MERWQFYILSPTFSSPSYVLSALLHTKAIFASLFRGAQRHAMPLLDSKASSPRHKAQIPKI